MIVIFLWNLSGPNCHRHGIYIIIGFGEKKGGIDFTWMNLSSRETLKASHEEQ